MNTMREIVGCQRQRKKKRSKRGKRMGAANQGDCERGLVVGKEGIQALTLVERKREFSPPGFNFFLFHF